MATVSRLKTWNANETLTAANLNAEFNNILNGINSSSLDATNLDATDTYIMAEMIVGSGISSADGSQLHVHTSSAGTITAGTDADDIVIENSGNAGLTILSGTSSNGAIYFGDSGDANSGMIDYDHNTNGITVTANAATAMTISSAAVVTVGGNVVSDTDSTDSLGTTSVRWANVYTDNIGDTGQDLTVLATTVNLPSGHIFD